MHKFIAPAMALALLVEDIDFEQPPQVPKKIERFERRYGMP